MAVDRLKVLSKYIRYNSKVKRITISFKTMTSIRDELLFNALESVGNKSEFIKKVLYHCLIEPNKH